MGFRGGLFTIGEPTAPEVPEAPEVLKLYNGRLVLDRAGHQVWVDGNAVGLTLHQRKLLETLMANPGQALTRERIQTKAWGDAYRGENAVDVQICRVRKALQQHGLPEVIMTVRGAGFKIRNVLEDQS